MFDKLNRHKTIIENLRNKFGENNYVAILNQLQTLRELEPDEDNQTLLDTQIELYTVKNQINEINKQNLVDRVLNGDLSEISGEINDDRDEKIKFIKLEREGTGYSVANNLKNRILHSAISYCLWKNSAVSKLGTKAHKFIASTCNTTEATVRVMLSRIVKGQIGGLTDSEKQYYVILLLNHNSSDKIDTNFSFLRKDTTDTVKQERISA